MGQARLRDERTAVLPVLLLPQKTYALSINCPSNQNFVSAADGLPSEPVPMIFTTGGEMPVLAEVRALHAAAYDEALRLIHVEYSYAARTGTDWDAQFAEHRDWVLAAASPDEFAYRLARILEPSDDPHLSVVMADETQLGASWRQRLRNSNREAISARFPGLRSPHDRLHFASDGPIGYIAVTSWKSDQQFLEAIDAAMSELYDRETLIIDVRDNGGGVEDSAMQLAAWFVEKPRVYARHRFRDHDSPTGWTEERKRWIGPHDDRYKRFEGERIIVLQGEFCLSSNEAFLLMMKQCERAISMGATSGGSSANPARFDLAGGMQLLLPRWEAMDADGVCFEGTGIAPDIAVEWADGPTDPVLEAALEMATNSPAAIDAAAAAAAASAADTTLPAAP
jgi:hypothetical protein